VNCFEVYATASAVCVTRWSDALCVRSFNASGVGEPVAALSGGGYLSCDGQLGRLFVGVPEQQRAVDGSGRQRSECEGFQAMIC